MEFKVSVTGYFYKIQEERLLELGFTFKPIEEPFMDYTFAIEGEPTINLNTIEELVKFSEKHGEIIVKGNTIEIYNDYRE